MDEQFYIWDIKTGLYWAPQRNGYTSDIKQAGIYNYHECKETVKLDKKYNPFKPSTAIIPLT